MKHLFIATLALLTFSSCSLLNFKSSSPQEQKAHYTGSVDAKLPVETATATRTPNPAPPKVAGTRPDNKTLGGGRWVIVAVDTDIIDNTDEPPYVEFETSTGRFYASDGCNILNGDYLIRSDGRMVFSNVLSTMKYCPDVPTAPLIARYLSDNSNLYIDYKQIGQDSYLYFRNDRDKPLMTLRRHNMEFLNGNWQVTAIDGTEVDNPGLNIFFDIAELKVHGNSGCNYFNGTLYIDPQRSNAMDISNIASTRMMCPDMDREAAMLVALESVATAVSGSKGNKVLLLDSSGHQVLTLKRLPDGQQ